MKRLQMQLCMARTLHRVRPAARHDWPVVPFPELGVEVGQTLSYATSTMYAVHVCLGTSNELRGMALHTCLSAYEFHTHMHSLGKRCTDRLSLGPHHHPCGFGNAVASGHDTTTMQHMRDAACTVCCTAWAKTEQVVLCGCACRYNQDTMWDGYQCCNGSWKKGGCGYGRH